MDPDRSSADELRTSSRNASATAWAPGPTRGPAGVPSGNGSAGRGIRNGARSAAGFVREKARAAADIRKSRVAEKVSSVADALDVAADRLERNPVGRLDAYGRKAAHRLHRFSDDLQHRSLGDLGRDLGEFGRRNPLAFVGGAFLAGVLLGRFLRSTEPGTGAAEFGEWSASELEGERFSARTSTLGEELDEDEMLRPEDLRTDPGGGDAWMS